MTTGKTIALTRQTFVGKVMSLLSEIMTAQIALCCFDFEVRFNGKNKSLETALASDFSYVIYIIYKLCGFGQSSASLSVSDQLEFKSDVA